MLFDDLTANYTIQIFPASFFYWVADGMSSTTIDEAVYVEGWSENEPQMVTPRVFVSSTQIAK